MKRLAAKIVAEKKIEIVEESLPPLGQGQVLLKHLCVAPSIGTFLHLYRGEHKVIRHGWRPEYPLTLAGNGVARVVEIGREVKNVKEGDLVTCRALSDFSVADPEKVDTFIPLPAGLDPEEASFLFQAQIALRGVRRAGVFLGDTVLVSGQGGIGILVSQLLKLAGAWRVIAADVWPKKLKVSAQLGVDVTIDAKNEDVVEKTLEVTRGKGVDLAIDVSGAPPAFGTAARACRNLGKVVVIGWFVEPFEINLADDFSPKGLEVVVCHGLHYFGDWKQYQKSQVKTPLPYLIREESEYLFDLMKHKRLKVKEIISHRLPLEQAAEAFRMVDMEPGECLGILMTM